MAGADKLARYTHVRVIGSGGMGTVALAQDTVLGRPVALKRVTGSAGDSGMLRLRREALVGASVSHPNLVSIFDVEENAEGELVIVMEYVEGGTLRDAIARDGGMTPSEALRVLSGAAAGLDAIHAQGIVHRDVKPANVLLGRDGSVKVADLGIAAVPDRTRITTSGSVMGSLSYMAPEQMHEAPATPAIDIYALAATAFEALSGAKARQESNPVALAYAIENKPAPDLRDSWPQAPAAAAELLRRAMDRDPGRRPRSAGELVDGLSAALAPGAASPPAVAAPPTTRTQRARPRPAAAPPPARPRSRPAAAAAPAPATAAAAAPAPPSRGRPLSRLIPAALLGLVLLGVALAVVLGSSGGSSTTNSSSARAGAGAGAKPAASASHSASRSTSSASSSVTTTSSHSASQTTSRAPTPASGGAPGRAAQSFYTLAAAHRYPQAWALAGPGFRAQIGGYQSFVNTFSGDRSITVDSIHTTSSSPTAATVQLVTTSVRTDGTQHCSGPVQLTRASPSAAWQLDHIDIACS